MWKWWFSKINLGADLPTEERGWLLSHQEKGRCEWAPRAPPLTPGVPKAAAVAEVKSSGTVKVFLRQWERPRPSGTGVERWQDSTWTLKGQTKPKRNLIPTPRNLVHPHEQPGRGSGWRWDPSGQRFIPGGCWLLTVGGLKGECPLRWRLFL